MLYFYYCDVAVYFKEFVVATTPKVVVSPEERYVVVEALKTQAAVYRRAARAENDPQVRVFREKAESTCTNLAAKLSTGELEF